MTHAFKPLCKDDIAEVLGVSIRTVENWVGEGKLPRPVPMGHRVYWHPVLFFEWLDQHLRSEAEKPSPFSDAKPGASRHAGVVAPKREFVGVPGVASDRAARELAKLRAQAEASVASDGL